MQQHSDSEVPVQIIAGLINIPHSLSLLNYISILNANPGLKCHFIFEYIYIHTSLNIITSVIKSGVKLHEDKFIYFPILKDCNYILL